MTDVVRIGSLGLALLGLLAGLTSSSASAQVPEEVLQAQQQRVAVVNQVRPAVVAIFGPGGRGGGSGVLISPDGYALSNYHVTRGAGGAAMQCGLDDGELYDAVLVGVDMTGDVALIKLLGRDDFPYVELGDSDDVQVGDWTFAMGNPFLLATDFTPTVTYGIVSGVRRYQYPAGTILEYTDCIQIDTSINPGNSGGPLFSSEGLLVGINGRGSFEKRGRVNVGVGYAISINQIKHFLGHLKSGRYVDHATLGATVNSTPDGRVVVADILQSSDAYRRGLRYNDEIVSFGGRRIDTVNTFKNVLGIYPQHWRVPLVYRRDGEQFEIYVRLPGAHQDGELEKMDKGGNAKVTPRGEEPKDKQPKPQPGGKLPEIVAKVFEGRNGYVNYYFNKQNQDRLVDGLRARSGDFSSMTGVWKFTGKTDRNLPVEWTTNGEKLLLNVPQGELALTEYPEDLTTEARPRGSNGLAVALQLWRRFLIKGPAGFGTCYYLGQYPVYHHPEMSGPVDVLATTTGGVETRLLFAPETGQLVSVEMFPGEDADPCILLLADYRKVEGRQLPHRVIVRAGDEVFGDYTIENYRLGSGGDAS